MREDVQKYLFIGPEEEKEKFFKHAQAQGVIHFIDPSARGRKEIPQEIHHLTAAIKILRGLPPGEQEENYTDLDADRIVDTILDLHEQSEKLHEELRVLEIEKSRIEVFGDFSFEDIAYIEKKGHAPFSFFAQGRIFSSRSLSPKISFLLLLSMGWTYYVAVNDHPVVYERMIEMKFDRPLSDLKKREAAAKAEPHQVEHKLKGYVKYNEYLHHALIEKLNFYNLYNTQTYVQQALGGSLFAIEGWVPANKVQMLDAIVGDLSIYYEEIAIEPADAIPTYLENHGLSTTWRRFSSHL